jgi:hypothetical protein
MKAKIIILLTTLGLTANAQLIDKSFHYMTDSKPTAICNIESHSVLRFFTKDTVIIENWSIKKCSPQSYNSRDVFSSKKYLVL